MVTQALVLITDQVQSRLAEISKKLNSAAGPCVRSVRFSRKLHGTGACITVTVCPAITTVPVRPV